MGQSARLNAQPIRTLAAGSIGATYTVIGIPFPNPIRIIYILNATNALLMFSFTGEDTADGDHVAIPAGGFLLLDVTTNKLDSIGLYISQQSSVYVRQIGVATTGSVYVSSFYAHPTSIAG